MRDWRAHGYFVLSDISNVTLNIGFKLNFIIKKKRKPLSFKMQSVAYVKMVVSWRFSKLVRTLHLHNDENSSPVW